MTDLLIRAAQFADRAHMGQVRKYSHRPYIEHPMRVAGAMMLRTDIDAGGIGEQVVCAAWLHDVLEDSPTTVEQLGEFGPVITTIVVELTHPPLSAGNRAKRNAFYFKRLAKASREAQIVKLLDRIDNLRDMDSAEIVGAKDKSFTALYAEESITLGDAIGSVDILLKRELQALAYKLRKEAL
jgi:(p)ppGpp synthase/HD superfamily hydrolase